VKNIARSKLVLASLLLSAFAAQAQTTPAETTPAQTTPGADAMRTLLPGTTGGYVGFNVGRTKFNTNCQIGFPCDTSDTGWKLYAGGQINPMLGVELGYVDFGKVQRLGGDTKAHGLNLSLVGTMPLGEAASLFGKVGTTLHRTRVGSTIPDYRTGRERDFGLSYGLGVAFNVTPQVQVVGEWERHRLSFSDQDQNVSLYSVGVRYRF